MGRAIHEPCDEQVLSFKVNSTDLILYIELVKNDPNIDGSLSYSELLDYRLKRLDLILKTLTAVVALVGAFVGAETYFAARKAEIDKPRRDLMLKAYGSCFSAIASYEVAYRNAKQQSELRAAANQFVPVFSGEVRLVWSKKFKEKMGEILDVISNAKIVNGKRTSDVEAELAEKLKELSQCAAADVNGPSLPEPAY